MDSNVIIRAHADYYPIDRIPQFWDWLVAEGSKGHAKIPLEIYDEITPATGPLKQWMPSSVVKDALILAEEVGRLIFNQVLDAAYAPDLTEDELEEAGCDPFLVAYGLMGEDRVIVTKETPRPLRSEAGESCRMLAMPCMFSGCRIFNSTGSGIFGFPECGHHAILRVPPHGGT